MLGPDAYARKRVREKDRPLSNGRVVSGDRPGIGIGIGVGVGLVAGSWVVVGFSVGAGALTVKLRVAGL